MFSIAKYLLLIITFMPSCFSLLKMFVRRPKSFRSARFLATGKTLVIVESPSKAKTIQGYVGNKYIVDSSGGHVRDLPKDAKKVPKEYRQVAVLNEIKLTVGGLGIDVMNSFKPIYLPLEEKRDVITRLQKHLLECDNILLATDEDREGEAISWHLLETLKPNVPYKRAVFHEITKESILESFRNPRDIDMNLVESQETRRLLDRLAGFTLSPLLWR